MVQVVQSATFAKWLNRQKDRRAVVRIIARIRRLETGNPGDVKPIGGGLSEMRINYGPGYRVYYMQRGSVFIVLLCGGSKRSQQADIKNAKQIAAEWKESNG